MKLLEYEAKKLLQMSSIPIPNGRLVIDANIGEIPTPIVLKSQVPTGGRGKLGGIKIVESADALPESIRTLFDYSIKGFRPRVILAEEKLAIKAEFYVSLIIDKPSASIRLMAHREGGVDVEERSTAEFINIPLSPHTIDTCGEQLAECFKLPDKTFLLQDMLQNLLTCFVENDATLLEINPFVLTLDGKLVAGDCKMELDNNAKFRHEWHYEEEPTNANFVTLHPWGTIATIANGAGLGMSTVDAVAAAGLTPANFLDIGGGANTESVLAAFNTIMNYSNIRAIVINIFAGITRCEEVAQAIIAAREQIASLPPLYIRLAGTNYQQAIDMLTEQGIATLTSLEEALRRAKEDLSHA